MNPQVLVERGKECLYWFQPYIYLREPGNPGSTYKDGGTWLERVIVQKKDDKELNGEVSPAWEKDLNVLGTCECFQK